MALKWVGAPGKRMEFEVTIVDFRTIEMSGESRFSTGTVALYKMADPNGNILTWFTGSGWNLGWEERRGEEWTCKVIGKRFHIKATVKEHKQFRGRPETAVSRVTVIKALADTDTEIMHPQVEEHTAPIEKPVKIEKCGCGGTLTVDGRFKHCSNTRMHDQFKCDCGEWLGKGSGYFETDYRCEKCEKEYNSNGSHLAPRSQWGEETGERFC